MIRTIPPLEVAHQAAWRALLEAWFRDASDVVVIVSPEYAERVQTVLGSLGAQVVESPFQDGANAWLYSARDTAKQMGTEAEAFLRERDRMGR